LLKEEERQPAELIVKGDNAGTRKHPAGAVHFQFESYKTNLPRILAPGR